jgi:hypothetical protein
MLAGTLTVLYGIFMVVASPIRRFLVSTSN